VGDVGPTAGEGASLLGQLRHVKNWNADIVSTRLRASRWFL